MLPTDRIQRAARHLVENAYRLGIGVGIADFPQRGGKFHGNFTCALLRTRECAYPNQGCRNVVEAACPDGLDHVTRVSQLVHDMCRRATLPCEQQVRLQHCEPLLVDSERIADEG